MDTLPLMEIFSMSLHLPVALLSAGWAGANFIHSPFPLGGVSGEGEVESQRPVERIIESAVGLESCQVTRALSCLFSVTLVGNGGKGAMESGWRTTLLLLGLKLIGLRDTISGLVE
jgi:hypothetical protein